MKKSISYLSVILALLYAGQVFSQEWEVPADLKATKNPLPFNNENVKAGKVLFMANCKSCHGDPGKYNALALTPPPPDITSEKMIANSMGSLFYKITTGRVAMPSFQNSLTDDQRWRIISYIKSYDPAVEGLLVKTEPVRAKITASADENSGVVSVSVQQQDASNGWIPLSDAEVFIKAKRTFGSIDIGKTMTNSKGYGIYQFPKGYKGDKEGIIDLELSLSDDYSSNAVSLNRVKIASPNEGEDLFKNRVLWSTNDRTQLWLILAYIGVVAGVWITIGYIIFLIFKIYKAGKS